MKRYPKLVQCDSRGQIVIPKEIRTELRADEGTGFWVYSIPGNGILLKRVEPARLEENDVVLKNLEKESKKIGITRKKLSQTVTRYKKEREGGLEII